MAALLAKQSLQNVENPEEDIPTTQSVDVETLITQKEQEVTNCREECNRLNDELDELKNLCPIGGECNWESTWYGSHGIKECTKCGKEEIADGWDAKSGGRRRKTRKRKGGFRTGQLVEIKWPNKDGKSFHWWKAGIIYDNGGPTIIVHWRGLYTNDGFPLHEEIQRPPRSHVRILSSGGTRKMRKMKKGGGNFFSSTSQEPQHRSLDELNPDDFSLGQTIVNILMQEEGLTRQDAIDETVNAHDYDLEVWNRYIRRANRRDQPLSQDMSGESKAENPQDGGKRKMKGGHHLYKRLGVSKYASQKQIRKAFKTLKKKRKANKKVKEAFKILSNKKSRKQYNNRYRKAVKRGGKRKTRRRKGGNENCYGFKDPKDSKLCNEISRAEQYYNTSHPERLSKGQKFARIVKNKTTRRKRPKPENQEQVAQQKRAAFLKFKDKLHPVLGKLKQVEDKIRAELKSTIEGPDDPMGDKQRELEAEYDEAQAGYRGSIKKTKRKIFTNEYNKSKFK